MLKAVLSIILLTLWAAPLFAQSVDTAWVRRYNGPGNSNDYAYAIAVDDSGNVYVTGWSFGNSTNLDYATIKYDEAGNEIWVRRYNGPANYWDGGRAIALDVSNNIYVTGHSHGTGTGDDYATIKYYPNGDTAWVRRYNGPINITDRAHAIATDDRNNIYITGYSSGFSAKYATVKYDSSGKELWISEYDPPGRLSDYAYALCVDGQGNICVTGASNNSNTHKDYATIKYDSFGNELWVRRYNSPDNSTDVAHAIAVDNSHNVYVTGYSHFTGTSFDYLTIKYDSFGKDLWARRYNGTADTEDWGRAIALDDFNNIYVTGWSWGRGTDYDYATVKYDSIGNELWVNRYDGPGNSDDRAYTLTVDGYNNVYVTGGSGGDYATIKYSSDGNEDWAISYNGLGNSHDCAWAMAVDGSCNVYVTGQSYGSGTSWDYATIKYVQFLRGDANDDDLVNIVDVVYMVNYVLKSGFAPDPIPQVGDVNCDDVGDITDVIYLVHYIFKGGPAPCI